MSDPTITDVITMLCDDPAELRRVFGPLADLPAWWRVRAPGGSVIRRDFLSRTEATEQAAEWDAYLAAHKHDVIPITPAARLADLKAGIE